MSELTAAPQTAAGQALSDLSVGRCHPSGIHQRVRERTRSSQLVGVDQHLTRPYESNPFTSVPLVGNAWGIRALVHSAAARQTHLDDGATPGPVGIAVDEAQRRMGVGGRRAALGRGSSCSRTFVRSCQCGVPQWGHGSLYEERSAPSGQWRQGVLPIWPLRWTHCA